MGKSTTGPDMLDVLQYMKEIERTSNQRIIVLLESDGYGDGGRWRAHAFTSPPDLHQMGESRGVGVTLRWPHREYLTFEAMMFRLMASLDGAWAQQEFLRITQP